MLNFNKKVVIGQSYHLLLQAIVFSGAIYKQHLCHSKDEELLFALKCNAVHLWRQHVYLTENLIRTI